MIAAANENGYARANVSNVIARAGVSRPTFYEYFTDKQSCFLAAHAGVHHRLLAQVRGAIGDGPPECALHAALLALVSFASSNPAPARFLTNEPMGAGPAALDARDAGIAEMARTVERAYASLDPAARVPDFSTQILLGGAYRMLAARLRRGEPSLSGLREDLVGWIGSYECPVGAHRWRELKPGREPPPSPYVPEIPLGAPEPLPRGRPRVSEEAVAENQRLRIMFAAAAIAEVKGYAAATVGEITKLARVDGRAFYATFADKQDAFMALHEFGFQQVMDVTAGAFFAGATWPERNWEAGRAFTQYLERNPMIGHVGFVEPYAVGSGSAQRLEDSQAAFAMLLQEGYQHVPQGAGPSRPVLEAVIATIFEIVYRRSRRGGAPGLPGLLPHLTFLTLSPFVGPVQANAFIDGKLAG
jgi:AcrR family transcriptional regulator